MQAFVAGIGVRSLIPLVQDLPQFRIGENRNPRQLAVRVLSDTRQQSLQIPKHAVDTRNLE